MKKVIKFLSSLIIICCVQSNLNAQTPLSISINPTFGTNTLQLDTSYSLNDTNTISFEMLKFYMSNIALYDNETEVWRADNSFYLMDYENPSSMMATLNVPSNLKFNTLHFDIGIDSMTNVSGAMGGDLDPTKGMYWTWQSGYVNFKLEGTSDLCESYKNEFQYHVGGYQAPYPTLQTFVSSIPENDYDVNIEMSINKFIDNISLKNESHIMSLGAKAVQLSELLPTIFKVQ